MMRSRKRVGRRAAFDGREPAEVPAAAGPSPRHKSGDAAGCDSASPFPRRRERPVGAAPEPEVVRPSQ